MKELKAIVDLFNSHFVNLNSIWTIFTLVGIGLIAFIYQADDLQPRTLVFLTIAFIIFASVNGYTLFKLQQNLYDTSQIIRQFPEIEEQSYSTVARKITAIEPCKVLTFYILIDIFIVFAIWFSLF